MDCSEENEDMQMENDVNDGFDDEELFDDGENTDDGSESNKGSKTDEKTEKKEELEKITKRVVKNPRVILNFERLKGPNGYNTLMETFKNFKFRGKHYEKEDLTAIMQKMQHWMCHHLYPGYDIETCMKVLEKLGRKRIIQTDMRKMRLESMGSRLDDKENVSSNNFDSAIIDVENNFDELLKEDFTES